MNESLYTEVEASDKEFHAICARILAGELPHGTAEFEAIADRNRALHAALQHQLREAA